MKTNNNWNDWRFQLHWKHIECVDPKRINSKNNLFCYSTNKFYIKYGKQTCNFFGHSKLKPIDYVASTPEIIASSNVAQRKKKASTKSSTSVKRRLMKHQVRYHY